MMHWLPLVEWSVRGFPCILTAYVHSWHHSVFRGYNGLSLLIKKIACIISLVYAVYKKYIGKYGVLVGYSLYHSPCCSASGRRAAQRKLRGFVILGTLLLQ